MCCNGTCFGECPFIRLFLSQVLDFGYSCGSLISAALGIFRTFQRLSATVSFKTKLSPESLEAFSWATDLIKIFTSIVDTNPLDEYDNFNLYTLILPITIIIYFTFIITGERLIFYFYFIIGLSIMLGAGFGFIGINNAFPILLIPIPIIMFLIIFLCNRCCSGCCSKCCGCDCDCDLDLDCCCRKNEEKQDLKTILKNLGEDTKNDIDPLNLYLGLPPTTFLFYALMIPIMLSRSQLIKVLSIIVGILSGLYILVALFVNLGLTYFFCCCDCDYDFTKFTDKAINFLTTILTLLIIPSTEHFIELMNSKYYNDWRCIVSYIVLSLLFPLLLTLFNILTEHDSIIGKYKDTSCCKCNFSYYVELIDIFRQLLYAIMASYDIVWVCLSIDLAWAVFIAICRPYRNKSEYILTWGNCLVTVMSNSVVIHASRKDIEKISLTVTVILVVAGCLPAIAAMYVFFWVDFDVDANSLDKKELVMNGFNLKFALVMTPISWFLFGVNLPLIDNKVYKQDY